MMLIKRGGNFLAVLAVVALLSLALACGKKADESAETGEGGAPTAAKYTPTGNEGSVPGKVAYTGAVPEARPIDMSADPVCAQRGQNAVAETVKVKDGKLQDVFVYIKDGQTEDGKKINDFSFDAPAQEVVLDQQGCQYRPHVLGIQTGQKLSVTNSDPTTHNVHPTPKNNQEWNQSQTSGAPPIVKTFSRPETLIPVKCNQHPWMKAYVGVLRHPFYAVTGEDGSYEIKGLPAGTYTVAAWHEKFGEKTMQVTVPAKGSASADFTFAEGAASNTLDGGSLKIMPALELPMLGRH